MQQRQRGGLRGMMTAAVLLAAGLPAGATVWGLGVTDGFYNVGTNWLGGAVPGAGDAVEVIFPGQTAMVWVPSTGDTTSASLRVDTGALLAMVNSGSNSDWGHTVTGLVQVQNGALLQLGAADAIFSLDLTVGGGLNLDTAGRVIVGPGSRLATPSITIGQTAGASASAAVTGVGAEMDVTGVTQIGSNGSTGSLTFNDFSSGSVLGGNVFVGSPGNPNTVGTLAVRGSADITVGDLFIGSDGQSGSVGTVTVETVGELNYFDWSLLNQAGGSAMTVGAASGSTGRLELVGTARYSSGNGLTTVNATGTVESFGEYTANGDVAVVGGTFLQHGAFIMSPGRTLTASAGGQVGIDGVYSIDNNTAFTVQTGADLTLGGGLSLATGANGTLVVDGAGSTVTTNTATGGTMNWGRNGGTAAVTFRNSATGSFGGAGINLAPVSGNASAATLDILTDADVFSNTLNIATGDYGTATVNIDGAGSNLWINGAHALNVGSANPGSTSTANVNLTNGAQLGTGTGTSEINATGTVHINGGTFFANGDLDVNGGTLMRTSGSFVLATGKTLTASNGGQVDFTGSYAIGNDTVLDLQSGADLHVTGFLDVGSGSWGRLELDGAGTTLTTNTQDTTFLDWGKNGAIGEVILSNHAAATINATRIDLAVGSASDTFGFLDIFSGADMTANSMNLATGSAGTAGLVIEGGGSTLTLNGASTLNIGGTGTSNASVIVRSFGRLTTGTGAMTINATGSVTMSSFGTLETHTIDHTHGGDFNFFTGTLRVVDFNGNLTNQGGILAPGGTPGDNDAFGTTTVNGDYTQQAGATLALQFNNTITPSTSYDSLEVTGHFAMAGTLELVFGPSGTAWNPGDRIDLLDWGTRSGTFDQLVLADITAFSDFTWNTQDLYITGEVSVEWIGDLNTDGFVGAADLDLLLAHWGETTHSYNFAGGDLSGDGLAGQADLDLIIAHWGNGTPPGNVPEPGTAALLGLMLLAGRRRRRRRAMGLGRVTG
ncbi:MAG: beta strand repeat-containing protein [Phycisphaerales bacterium JB063]